MANNKVALITGAGSGVGRAVAIKFLKDGYKVGLMGRRADALNETIALAGASCRPRWSRPAVQRAAASTVTG